MYKIIQVANVETEKKKKWRRKAWYEGRKQQVL